MATKTYHGSCRCGKIKFEADLDLSEGTSKCNCTYCWKARWWGARAKQDGFRLLSGSQELGFGFTRERFVERGLCKTCAITPFGWGAIPEIGGNYISINLACLDDLPAAELAAAPVTFMDGRNDNWWESAGRDAASLGHPTGLGRWAGDLSGASPHEKLECGAPSG